MKTKLIEGTNPDGLYLKAMICTFEPQEWERKSLLGEEADSHQPLLKQESWTPRNFCILDISRPGVAGKFTMGKDPRDAKWAIEKLDLRPRPLMLPFVEWIFETGFTPNFPMDLPDRVWLRSMSQPPAQPT